MAIRAEFIRGEVSFPVNGSGARMSATIELIDDTLGRLSSRTIEVDDPAIVASVTAYVEQMLPTLTAATGVDVSLPVAAEVVDDGGTIA